MSRTIFVISAIALGATLIGCGGRSGLNTRAEAEQKRNADRIAMQVEGLTTQRNALKAELDRVREAATTTQRELTSTRDQLLQTTNNLNRANSELSSMKSQLASLELQKAQMETLRAQLSQLEEKMKATPIQTAEQRVLSSPTTQPNLNK